MEPDTSLYNTLTLISQGGGIGGGAYIVGVMKALASLEVMKAVQKTITSSASNPAVIYSLMGMGETAEYIWTEKVTQQEVIDVRRVLEDKPILDIDYLVDEILAQYPLDKKLFQQHTIDMHIGVTRRDGTILAPAFFTNKDHYDPLQMIKASIAIPLLYGKTIPIAGHEYLDQGIVRQIPFPEDAKYMIVILTSHEKKEAKAGFGERALLRWYKMKASENDEIYRAVAERHTLYLKEYNRLLRKQLQGAHIVIIQPESPLPADIICRDPHQVQETIHRGYVDTIRKERELHQFLDMRLAS